MPDEKRSMAVVFFEVSRLLKRVQSSSPWVSRLRHDANPLGMGVSVESRMRIRSFWIPRSDAAELIFSRTSSSEMMN